MLNNKNLESFGVQELNTIEVINIDGGRPPSLLDGAFYNGATFVHAAVDFVSGALDRFNLFRD